MKIQPIIEEQIDTTVDAILFIVEKLGGDVDFHRIFKILYFAEREHLVRYGKLFSGDTFIAMENGPVPSMAYDILKSLKGEGLMYSYKERFSRYFALCGKYSVVAVTKFDPDNLADSAVECLQHSIDMYGSKTFQELTKLSHDTAYTKAKINNEMNASDIAVAGGADENMIAYILESIENTTSILY